MCRVFLVGFYQFLVFILNILLLNSSYQYPTNRNACLLVRLAWFLGEGLLQAQSAGHVRFWKLLCVGLEEGPRV